MAEKFVGETALNELVKYIKPEIIHADVALGNDIQRTVFEKILDYTCAGRNFVVQFNRSSNTFHLLRPLCVFDFYGSGTQGAKNPQATITFCDNDTIYVYKLGSAANCICTTFKITQVDALSATDVSSKF